jgi:putative ABC transport system permease protein
MNIMLVSVTERTAEIGLKKAIGAPKRTIMNQFLTEAVVLTATGGVLGVATGLALAELISRLTGAPVAVNWGAVLLAVGFSMVIGIVFGILPSKKAADLDPIEALRRE